jgi:drug/metabolite transporter (DMT)-like permease
VDGPDQPGHDPNTWRALWSNGPLLLAVCMLSWAGSVITGRAAAALVPPSLFTLLRWAGALLIVLPLAWRYLRYDIRPLLRRWPVVAALALLGVDAYNNLVYRGLHSTTAVNALLLSSATPLFVILAVFFMFGERPSLRQVLAILVSITGVLVIAAQGSLAALAALSFNPGDVLVTVAVACYAVYSALLRLRPAVHPLSLLAASFAIGVVFLIPLAASEYLGGARLHPTPLAIGAILYSCVFPAFVSYLFFNRGVELVGPARAGQYLHLMPVFGVLLAVLFLGETLHSYHIPGIALIATGLWLAR